MRTKCYLPNITMDLWMNSLYLVVRWLIHFLLQFSVAAGKPLPGKVKIVEVGPRDGLQNERVRPVLVEHLPICIFCFTLPFCLAWTFFSFSPLDCCPSRGKDPTDWHAVRGRTLCNWSHKLCVSQVGSTGKHNLHFPPVLISKGHQSVLVVWSSLFLLHVVYSWRGGSFLLTNVICCVPFPSKYTMSPDKSYCKPGDEVKLDKPDWNKQLSIDP